MLAPLPAGAGQIDIHLMPVMDSGAADADMSALLRSAVVTHAGAGWNVVSVAAGSKHGCTPGKSCAVVRTKKTNGTYTIVLVAGNGEVLASRSVEPPVGAAAEDVADTLAIKIVFLMEKFHVPILEKKGPTEAPAPEKKPPPPVEPVVEPEPVAKPEPPTKPEPVAKPGPPAPPVKPEPTVRYRLTLDGVQTTGFSADFNTGGLEPGLLLLIHRSIGVRLDLGVHLGGAKRKALCLEAVTLPVSLMAGYRIESGKLAVSFSAGIMMVAMWLEYWAETCGTRTSVRLGAAARIDVEVRVGEKVTLGLFVRPAVFTDHVRIRGVLDMHYVMLTSGLSLLFDLGSTGGTP